MSRFYFDDKDINSTPDFHFIDQTLTNIDKLQLLPKAAIQMVQIDGIPLYEYDLSNDTAFLNSKAITGFKR